MTILIIGASGRAGKQILREALERGQVRAVVRDAAKIQLRHPQLNLIQGMPNDPAAIEEAVAGCQAVLFALNVSRTSDWPWARLRSPADLVSDSIGKIAGAMQRHRIARIISLSAWGANESFAELPGWFGWLIRHSNIRYPYADHERHERILQQTALQWTIIRPSGLTNSRRLKALVISKGNQPRVRFTISRRHLAKFMLDCLEQQLYQREIITVSES